jgi:hypothetical protein
METEIYISNGTDTTELQYHTSEATNQIMPQQTKSKRIFPSLSTNYPTKTLYGLKF